MKPLIVTALAIALAGCETLATYPHVANKKGLTALTPVGNGSPGNDSQGAAAAELKRVVTVGGAYKALAETLSEKEEHAGGFLLASGFYSAATTAFRPAAKNLKAAILAIGVGQAWQTALKPAERAKVYVQGYRAMDCINTAGAVFVSYDPAGPIKDLRGQIRGLRTLAAAARTGAIRQQAGTPTPGIQALLARLDVLLERLTAVEKALSAEEVAARDAFYRISTARAQAEDTVDKRLLEAAPDYAGALKLLSETAKPEPAKPETGGEAEVEVALEELGGPKQPPTPEEALRDAVTVLEARLPSLEAETPTRAVDAYKRVGECAANMG